MIYDTNKVLLDQKSAKSISKEDILKKVSEYDIFSKYLGPFKIGKAYKSPLREDRSPSFAVFVSSRDKALLYRDMGSGDCGDVFKFVKRKFGLTRYKDVLEKIDSDLNLASMPEQVGYSYYNNSPLRISIKRIDFSEADARFWGAYGISAKTLSFYNVSSISSFFINNIKSGTYKKNEPMYAYKVFNKFKIYRPLSDKSIKWRGNLGSLDIQGFEQLPEKGNLLIITKSLKDVMVLYELGYNSIAPASESTIIPEIAMGNIKKRFKKIVVFYDRDATGMKFARKMVNQYSLDFMFIDKKHETKDISDFVKKFGIKKAKLFMKSKLS